MRMTLSSSTQPRPFVLRMSSSARPQGTSLSFSVTLPVTPGFTTTLRPEMSEKSRKMSCRSPSLKSRLIGVPRLPVIAAGLPDVRLLRDGGGLGAAPGPAAPAGAAGRAARRPRAAPGRRGDAAPARAPRARASRSAASGAWAAGGRLAGLAEHDAHAVGAVDDPVGRLLRSGPGRGGPPWATRR